jgi:hypothetical protein
MKKIISLTLGASLLASSCFAGDLKAPFSFPTAKVLPKGIRNLSMKGLFARASQRLDENGETVVLANALNSTITFQKVYDSKKTDFDKASILNVMHRLGKDFDDSFGYSTGDVRVAATARVPVFAFGLTNKITIAAAVPVIKSSMRIKTGVVQQNEDLHSQMIQTLNQSGVPSKVVETMNKLSMPITEKLNEYGYLAPVGEEKDELGDIKLVGKYNNYQDDKVMITSQVDVTLPTGKDANVMEVVDVASGDDQTDLGLGVAVDYKLSDSFSFSGGFGYQWQLADSNAERIPEVSYSRATPDIDWNTKRDLGNVANLQLAGNWSYKGFNLGAGYSYQSKEKDRYSGNQFSSERYEWLTQETKQEMQSMQVTAGLDTIYLFRKKAFPAPLKIMFTYTNVIDGINVVKDPLYSVDFNMYF